MSTFDKVRGIISNASGVPIKEIMGFTKLVELIDSLERAQLLMDVEEELGIEIPEDDAQKFCTVQDVIDYAQKMHIGAA